ncbi:hypothetical protein FHT92_001268 [Rhizobium sp. BK377]|nr:hypothetical protein [Rhizobium sp. BK377]MBB3460690.1 hypothetical protein [Rhizobium sp. BK377]
MELTDQPSDCIRQVSARGKPLHCNADDDSKLSLRSAQEIWFIILVG